jgi:hypothetical protein
LKRFGVTAVAAVVMAAVVVTAVLQRAHAAVYSVHNQCDATMMKHCTSTVNQLYTPLLQLFSMKEKAILTAAAKAVVRQQCRHCVCF